MYIIERATGEKHKVVVEPVIDEDYKSITKKKYFFNWKTEKRYNVYKLRRRDNDTILGLISLKHYKEETRIEIKLLGVSIENRGKNKQYEKITGILISYACREAIKDYGIDGCVSLFPKTELKQYYISEYGMMDAGKQVFLTGLPLLKILNNYQMKTTKLFRKYAPKELAETFVFRTKLSAKQKSKSDMQLNEMRKKARMKVTSKQVLLSHLLQLKYQIEDYSNNAKYDIKRSFGYFLREYLKSLNKKNKDFANDIDIDETELSQILNQHRKPSEKIIIRLELHSNKTIPAITWFRLLEKEKEHEILTNNSLRRTESRHVKNRLKVSI